MPVIQYIVNILKKINHILLLLLIHYDLNYLRGWNLSWWSKEKGNFLNKYTVYSGTKTDASNKTKKVGGIFLVSADKSTRNRMSIVVGRAGFEPA